MGKIVDMDDLKAQPLGHLVDRVVSERTAAVSYRCNRLLRDRLDGWQVVVALPHLATLTRVGAPRLFGRCDGEPGATVQFTVQAHDRAQGAIGDTLRGLEDRQPEFAVARTRLEPLEFDLQRGTLIRRRGIEKLGERHAEPFRNGRQQRQARFPVTVFDEGQLARTDTDVGAELIERETGDGAKVTHPSPQSSKIRHIFRLEHFSHNLCLNLAFDLRSYPYGESCSYPSTSESP